MKKNKVKKVPLLIDVIFLKMKVASHLLGVFLIFGTVGVGSGEPANRVVSLSPGVTEIIYAIKAEDKLVGVVTPADYPPGIKKPVVGSFMFPNLERIVALKPDIVFVTDIVQRRLWDKFKELNLNYIIIAPKNIDEIYRAITMIGGVVGYQNKADSLVIKMRKEIEQLQDKQPIQKRRVFVEISEVPLFSCGKGSFIHEMIQASGEINIIGDIEQPYPIVNSETIIQRDPEVIIMLHHGGSLTAPDKRLGWQNITAVKERRVYGDIDENLVVRTGPRIVEGIKALRLRFYPEIWEKETR